MNEIGYGKKKQTELPPLPIIAIAMIIVAGIAGIALYATQSSSVSHVGPSQPISSNPAVILPEKNYCEEACDSEKKGVLITTTPIKKQQIAVRMTKRYGPFEFPVFESKLENGAFVEQQINFDFQNGEAGSVFASSMRNIRIGTSHMANRAKGPCVVIVQFFDKNGNIVSFIRDEKTNEKYFSKLSVDEAGITELDSVKRTASSLDDFKKVTKWGVLIFEE